MATTNGMRANASRLLRRKIAGWSDVHRHAEAHWYLAEASYIERPNGLDPGYRRDGILTYGYDALEEHRKRLRLPMAATPREIADAVGAPIVDALNRPVNVEDLS